MSGIGNAELGSGRRRGWNPSQELPEWRLQAACVDADPALFFPVGKSSEALRATAAAKMICARCPVRDTCAEFALVTNQDHGVWGGLDEDQRRSIRRSWRAQRRGALGGSA